jgi:hypothetical protein
LFWARILMRSGWDGREKIWRGSEMVSGVRDHPYPQWGGGSGLPSPCRLRRRRRKECLSSHEFWRNWNGTVVMGRLASWAGLAPGLLLGCWGHLRWTGKPLSLFSISSLFSVLNLIFEFKLISVCFCRS